MSKSIILYLASNIVIGIKSKNKEKSEFLTIL